MKSRRRNPLSPDLTVYYDTRYHQFFFAGAHHPKRDGSSIPKVEVFSLETSPDKAPILVTPDKDRQRPKSSRVSWAESVRSNIKQRRWATCVSVMVCVALMVAFGIGLVLIVPIVLFSNEPTSADDDFGTTLPMDGSLYSYIPPSNGESWSTADADHSTPEPFAVGMPRGKKNDSRVSAQHAAALVAERVDENAIIVNACLLDNAGVEQEQSFWSTRASSCDIVVECGYSIDKKMRLRPSAQSVVRNSTHRFGRVEQGGARKSGISVLLCVSIDNEFLQNVAVENEGQVSKLVRNIVLQLRSGEYEGICLRLPATPNLGRGYFLNTIRTIADRLSARNNTVSLLLPYGPPRRTLRHEITQLVATLGRPHAVLVYPAPALFRTKAKWPSPKDIAFLPPKTSAKCLLPASSQRVRRRCSGEPVTCARCSESKICVR
ncbi:hypothetical protein MTO96_008516 [Rhipicephalus appendiculatus]